MGCGCQGGSGLQAGSGVRRTSLIKKPGYTWNGPEQKPVEENDTEAVAEPDEES